MAVEPGRALGRDLLVQREVGSGGERMPLLALVVLPGPQFDNRPWPCVDRHVDVAEPQMMAAPIHAFDDGIGRARQFVMQATFDQAAKHGIADLLVRSAESRVGQEWVSTGISQCTAYT